MKKAFIGLLILILSAWAQYVFSAEPIQLARMNPYVAGGVNVAVASCETGTLDFSAVDASDTAAYIGTQKMGGQSFTIATNGSKLYSIKIKTYAYNAVTGQTITIRYGTSEDLGGTCGAGNNCLKEASSSTVSWNATETKWIEVVFKDTNILSTGTTYYFMVHSSVSTDDLGIVCSTSSIYANGVAYATGSDASDWNLSGHNENSGDVGFEIYRCD